MTTDDLSPKEQAIARARSIKAFKLARVLRVTDVPTDDFRTADEQFRAFVAEKAGVNVPSDASWTMACDTLELMRQRDT